MKVKELIAKLQEMPQDVIIVIPQPGDPENPSGDPREAIGVDLVWMIERAGYLTEYRDTPPIENPENTNVAVCIQ